MALSGYEVLGNFLNEQSGLLRSDRKQREGEQRQERLINEQRQYETTTRRDERDFQVQKQIEAEKRSLVNGLVAAGLLPPGEVDNPTAVAMAFEKTSPEWRQEFQEKKELRDEIAKLQGEGAIDDVQIFSQDIDTLRNIAAAARQGAGDIAKKERSTNEAYKHSVILENEAQAKARADAAQRQQNAAYWVGEANNAAAEMDNPQLTPEEEKQIQAAAAQVPGASTSPEIYQIAYNKAKETAIKSKQMSAYMRVQNAQRAATVGAAPPGTGTPQPGASTAPAGGAPAPSNPDAAMNNFIGGGKAAPAAPASATPAADTPGNSISLGDVATTGIAMAPLERLIAAIPTVSRFAPVVPAARGAVLGYQAGKALTDFFPMNPLARIGRSLGSDINIGTGNTPNFGPLTEADYAALQRRAPLPGSSVGNPYQ